MKIAIDISQIVHEGTGVARYTRNLVTHLLEEDDHNEYHLFGYSFGKKNVLDEYVRKARNMSPRVYGHIFPLPERIVNVVWNAWHVISLERCIGHMDVVHSSDWIQPPTHAKTVTTIHDVIPLLYPDTSHPYIIRTQKKRLEWVKKECDHIIADSHATKEDVSEYVGIPREKISVVYPGVDDVFFSGDSALWIQVSARYDIPKEYILSVGTQEPRKNLHRLIEAYMLLKKQKMDIPDLVIIGKYGWGEEIPDVSGVHILGYVPEQDLPLLYRHAMMFVCVSLYEGFGLPVVEAMASGCPIITSQRGSLREVAGGAAYTVDPEDTHAISRGISDMWEDHAMRDTLMQKAKEKATIYTWKKAAQQVIDIYTQKRTVLS